MEKIWCLFSIANEYNQPENNLEAWWKNKPSFEILAQAIGIKFEGDENILGIVHVSQGIEERIAGSRYRLELVKQGKL